MCGWCAGVFHRVQVSNLSILLRSVYAMQKISVWSDVVAVILFDWFLKIQSTPPQKTTTTTTPQYIMCHVLCVCVVFVVVLFFQLYAFIILRAHHDHNNIAPCGIIKVF